MVYLSDYLISYIYGVSIRLTHLLYLWCIYQTNSSPLSMVYLSDYLISYIYGVSIRLPHLLYLWCIYQTNSSPISMVYLSDRGNMAMSSSHHTNTSVFAPVLLYVL